MLRYPVTFGHNSFAFNAHLNADGTQNTANLQNTVVIDERTSETTFREGRDAYHLTTGGALGRAHKGFGVIRLRGRVLVPNTTQDATRSDVERAMRAAFDPDLCYRDSPTTDGAYALDFSEATADTTTYPTGRIPLRYYCRPMSQPSIVERLADGAVLAYALGLIAADPRCYEQTEQTLVLSPGTGSGSVVNRGNAPSVLKATIVMSGAGVTNFTIALGGKSFVLNLSTMANLDTVVVLFDTSGPYGEGKKITKNGTSAFSLKTSSASTWLSVPTGTNTATISDGTNLTSCTLAWRSARA